MILSMTGVAKTAISLMGSTVIIEMQSLNRKGLEVHISLPEEFQGCDFEIRKKIQERLGRGTIQLRVYLKTAEEKGVQGLEADYAILSEVASSLKLSKPTLSDLLLYCGKKREHLVQREIEPEVKELLLKAIDDALTDLIDSRSREGRELLRDLTKRLGSLESWIEAIERLKEESRKELIQKMQEKYEELFSSLKEENLLYRELVLFVEKSDIAEELVRFKGHLLALAELFEKKDKVPGKTIEFYIHELQREASTIAAKCLDPKIGHLSIEIRSELERIREQLQNIE